MGNNAFLFVALAVAALLLSGCPGGGGGGGGTPTPLECPTNPAQNGPNCAEYSAPSALFNQSCELNGGNATYVRDNQTCCITEVQCVGPAGAVIPIDVSPSAECVSDTDCKVAGCSSQWCMPAAEDVPSECIWKPQYECYSKTTCGCVNETCAWRSNPEFSACIANATGGAASCPNFTAPGSDDLLACSSGGGAMVSSRGADGCFTNASCSLAISCTAFSYNCPAGFACNATANSTGACKVGGDMCGGPDGRDCPEGSRCELPGDYPDAAGACRRLCSSDATCANGTECVGGSCEPAQGRLCDASNPCPAGFACQGGACMLGEGRLCGTGMPPCPADFSCDTSAGAGNTGACRAMCGGAADSQCPVGRVCISNISCRAHETCMDYAGMCIQNDIPDSLPRLCDREFGGMSGNVSGFSKCRESALFVLRRIGSEFAYMNEDGTLARECGPAAPPNDPQCQSMSDACNAGTEVTCDDLSAERYVTCPPPYSAASNCPQRSEPVCAKLMIGAIPALRTPEWRTFSNGCEACNANNPSQVAYGYWRGEC